MLDQVTLSTLMRMGGKKLDHAGRGAGIEQEFVNGFERRYLLEVAIASRVVVRPGNRLRLDIVWRVSRFVAFSILTMKKMRAAHASQVVYRRPNVLMISGYQQPTAAAVKASYRSYKITVADGDCLQPSPARPSIVGAQR